jgi:protein involved in polysaccharide export with SLBB domain
MGSHLSKVYWLFLLILVLAGCSTTEPLGPQGMQGAMLGEPLGDYQLRQGDELQIKFFNNSDLNANVMIGPDGKISLQLVGEVLAAGLTSSQLDDVLTEEYLKYLQHVNINVVVREYAGLRVYVGGEVNSPGFYSLKTNMSVLNAILVAKGWKETAKMENVILVRKGPGNRPVAMAIDLKPVIAGEQIENDIYVMPSDIVYVPKTWVGKAGIFVRQWLRDVFFVDRILNGVGYALGYEWVQQR